MTSDEELRKQAIGAIRRKRGFRAHLAVYLIVNVFLIGAWYMTGSRYFWPGWVIAGWGIGVALNGWAAYGPGARAISEAEIEREINRLR